MPTKVRASAAPKVMKHADLMLADVDDHTRLVLYNATGKRMAAALGYSLAAASETDVTTSLPNSPKSVVVYMYKNGDANKGAPFLSCKLSAAKGTDVYSVPGTPVVVVVSRQSDGSVHIIANTTE